MAERNRSEDKHHFTFFITASLVIFIALACTDKWLSYVVGIALPLTVYGVYVVCLKECGILALIQRESKKDLALYFIITALYLLCIFGIMMREDFVYFWDYGSYWYKSFQDVQNALFLDPAEALRNLIISINTQEYNGFLAWIIAIPLKILGNSYLAFVLLVAGMFLLPALGVLSVFICKVSEQYCVRGLSFMKVYLMVLSITVPLFPVLSGYIDAAGMLPLALCYLLILHTDYAGMVEWKKSFLIGILLVMTLFMRRYFGYAVVGFVLCLVLYAGFGEGIGRWKCGWKNKMVNIMITGFTSLFILVVFFRQFLIRCLFNNYNVAYSAYNMHGFLEKWKSFFLYYGAGIVFLVICFVLCSGKRQTFYFSVFMILSLVLSMLLFYSIQDMGEHHYYITAIPMISSAVLGYGVLHGWMEKFRFRLGVPVFEAVVACICILNFGFSLGMLPRPANGSLFIQRTYIPKIRQDHTSLMLMENELEQLDTQGYKGVYVVASSGILNNDILLKRNAPLLEKKYQLCSVSHVDLRDGFQTQFFDADVIIDCSPLQVHLSKDDQSVISLLHDLFAENDRGEFSDKYMHISSYVLDGGVEADLYIKQKKLQKSDIEYVRDLFDSKYEGYPALFRDRFNEYIRFHFE